METPNIEQLKKVIETKGYDNPWKVNHTKVTNEKAHSVIPIDYFYRIVNDSSAVKEARSLFKEMGFSIDSSYDAATSLEFVSRLNETLFKKGFIKDRNAFYPETTSASEVDITISKMVFIGIKMKKSSKGYFNDMLIACDSNGTVFKVFNGCASNNFATLINSNSEFPICIKPGLYKNLFKYTVSNTESLVRASQATNIDLYTFNATANSYSHVFAGNIGFTIGSGLTGSPAFEFKNQEDDKVFSDILSTYVKDNYVELGVITTFGTTSVKVEDNLQRFSYILLEESDFE